MSEPIKHEFKLLAELVVPVQSKIMSGRDESLPYVGLEQIRSRTAHLNDWLSATSSISTNAVFQAGDILFGKLRPNLRKCVSAPFDGYCSTDILVLRARASVNPRFATRVFQSDLVGRAAERTAIGTKMPRTSWEALREVLVFVPATREQEAIADVLDRIDTSIQQTETTLDKLKQLKQGLLHDLLTRGIDSNGELRPTFAEAPDLYKHSPVGMIPAEWSANPFEVLCSSSAFGPRFPSDAYDESGPLTTLRTTDMDDEGSISLETMPRAAIPPVRFADHLLQSADLVISRSGSCGIAGVFYGHSLPVVPGAFLIRFRLYEPPRSEFYRRYFNSSVGRPRLERLAEGGVQKNIKGSDVLNLRVPVPPLEESNVILRTLQTTEQLFDLQTASLQKLREEKLGLMDDLLTGRVRVTSLL